VNPAVNPTGVAIGADMAATVIAAMIGVAVAIAAVAIISVAIISMAICTSMMSAVDASNAPGC
jgi:hypothetical protein